MIKFLVALFALLVMGQGCPPKKLVLVGDSTIACDKYFDPAISAQEELGPGWVVVNEAIPSTSSYSWREEIAQIVKDRHGAAHYFVILGINDWFLEEWEIVVPWGTTEANEALDQIGVILGPNTWIAEPTPVDRSVEVSWPIPGKPDITIHDYADWWDELTPTRQWATSFPPFSKYDGLHHDNEGCEALGSAIGQFVKNSSS